MIRLKCGFPGACPDPQATPSLDLRLRVNFNSVRYIFPHILYLVEIIFTDFRNLIFQLFSSNVY